MVYPDHFIFWTCHVFCIWPKCNAYSMGNLFFWFYKSRFQNVFTTKKLIINISLLELPFTGLVKYQYFKSN